MVPHIVQAVQDLDQKQKRITELNAEVKDLKGRLEKQEQQMKLVMASIAKESEDVALEEK